MENNSIDASVSTQSLIFRSGGDPVSFEVSVSNNSYQFADFHLDISAPGESRNPGSKWYRLAPDVASAQPHGSTTKFQVIIFDTPLPGFAGTVNLSVKIFSPQLRQERRLVVRLEIEAGRQSATVSVELPVKQFQVYPRNIVDIPVRVRNLSQQFAEVVLRLTGIDPSWCVGGGERRLGIDPVTQVEIVFQCQPPSVVQAPSQNYPFSVEVIDRDLPVDDRQGNLEVLPVGFVELTIDPHRRELPTTGQWLPNWKSRSTSFRLFFKNASNVRQQVDVVLQGRDERKCRFSSSPPQADLDLGATTQVDLNIETTRPWLGIGKTLSLEAKGMLSDRRLGIPDPAVQSLEVRVLPLLPFWFQVAAIAILAATIGWLLKPAVSAHTNAVNSVRFSGDASTVISGSEDGTIRRWQVSGNKLEPDRNLPGGLLANPNRGEIKVLRFMPQHNNLVAAGLRIGLVQLWNVPTAKKISDLEYPESGQDRIYDLVFTQDSKYLFVGYGSGKVRVWHNSPLNGDFQPVTANLLDLNPLVKLSFQVHTLALSPDRHTLAIGGNFKRFILWEWDKNSAKQLSPTIAVQKLDKLDSNLSAGNDDYIWSLTFAPKAPNILATADSDGYVTIWDLSQCQQGRNSRPATPVRELDCQKRGVLDRWQAGQKGIRSIVFNEDGQLLASAGDDGKIVVWSLNSEYKHDPQGRVEVYDSNQKINSIDMKKTTQGVEIVSGGKDFQVRLHRMK
jgi:WD40 repeat protein